MIGAWALQEYRRLRRLGWQAGSALSHARTYSEWLDLESRELVRFEAVPDHVYQTDDEIVGDGATAAQRAEILDRAQRDGMWGIQASYRLHDEAEWIEVDSVWGFIGDDWKDSGYDSDVKASAIDAYHRACEQAAQRAVGGNLR